MTIENQNIENKQVEEVKPKRKYKKRACALRKKTCEKYDVFLNLINLQGDYMMLQAHFIYLAVVMDYATVAQLQNDILPDMKRMGLVKTQYVGGTQAVMLVLKKTAIRHLKGLESSKNAFSVKETSSDFPKLLNIMKIDYIIETVLEEMEVNHNNRTEFLLNVETLKDYLKDNYSTVLLKQKDEPDYYYRIFLNSELVEDDEQVSVINEIRRYSIYNLARQKSCLKQGVALNEKELKALDYHENYFTKYYPNASERTCYQNFALIKDPKNVDYNPQGRGDAHKPKKNQPYPDKLIEYDRLPNDPRLFIAHYQKQNVYIEKLTLTGPNIIIFNLKKSISKSYIKDLIESLATSFRMIYGFNFELNIKIYFFNDDQVNSFKRMWSATKGELERFKHQSESLTVEAISMDIEDDYLVTSNK